MDTYTYELTEKTIKTKMIQYIQRYKCHPYNLILSATPDKDEDDNDRIIVSFRIKHAEIPDTYYTVEECFQPTYIAHIVERINDEINAYKNEASANINKIEFL